jgi:type IV secretory pathway VirB6-like protein
MLGILQEAATTRASIASTRSMTCCHEFPPTSFFSNLITDQTGYLASTLSARSIQDAQQTLNTLWNALEQPDPWSLLANLLYWTLLIVIGLAQFAVLFVVFFGMIASAVCALLGPLFIPFFIVPTPSSSSSNASSAAFCKRCPPGCAWRISCSTASTSS